MRTGADRLRVGLVVCLLGLLLVVGGFLGYARYRSRLFRAGLPGRLGANIARETDGFTYSQTVEGRTIFTLHAAKMEQRRDGLVKLHDVGVVVYGRKQDRADRIYGKEFEYDQAAGIVRALGLVNIDLQAPAVADGKRRLVSAAGAPLDVVDARVIHVTTSGLIYLTKLGVAATGEEVNFSEGSLSGRAHGADFNSDTGVVVLESAVRMNGLMSGGPMVLTADRAELDRNSQVANLAGARLVTPAETVEADQAVVFVRKDGSPERVEGSGGVRVTRAEGGVLRSARAELALSEGNRATGAQFGGGVQFVEEEAGRRAEGEAATAIMRFDTAGLAEQIALVGSVTMTERDPGTLTKTASRRTLTGNAVDLALGPAGGRKRELRTAHASGSARLLIVNETTTAQRAGATTDDVSGDEMTAHFAGGGRVSDLLALGHTVLRQTDAGGVEERSAADRTEMAFNANSNNSTLKIGDLRSAVQTGQVVMQRKSVRGQGPKRAVVDQRGTAERSEFNAATNQVTLTGRVMLGDGQSTIGAARVTIERTSGDAAAEGGVRVSYAQPAEDGKAAGQMDAVADHALLRRGEAGAQADRSFFYGVAGRPARLWQGGSQVEAPILEFDQGERRLRASGASGSGQVHAVLVQEAATSGGKTPQNGPVRVVSREMVYSDAAREVVFRGGVVVMDGDGTMRSDEATALLQGRQPTAPKESDGTLPFPGGGVDRIVATGGVEVEQPGRRGFGARLVYTAADGMIVMTGTPGMLPRVEDETRGTVTGAALRFHRGDDSVVVNGAGIEPGADLAKRRVRTETRVKQQ